MSLTERAKAGSTAPLRLEWRYNGTNDWKESSAIAKIDKDGLYLSLISGAHSGEDVGFPQPKIEYRTVDLSSAAVIATSVAATAASQADQQRAISSHVDANAMASRQLVHQQYDIDDQKQALAARDLELNAEKGALQGQWQVALTKLQADREALATHRERTLADIESAQNDLADASAAQRNVLNATISELRKTLIANKADAEAKKQENEAATKQFESKVERLEAIMLGNQMDYESAKKARKAAESSTAAQPTATQLTELMAKAISSSLNPLLARLADLEGPRTHASKKKHTVHNVDESDNSDDETLTTNADEARHATDVDDPTSCKNACTRWCQRDKDLEHQERATSAFLCVEGGRPLFETEWRRRLAVKPAAPEYHSVMVNDTIDRLLCAFDLLAASRDCVRDAKLKYLAHKNMRLNIEAAVKLRLTLNGADGTSFPILAAKIRSARNANRRGKVAYVSMDTIFTDIMAKQKKKEFGGAPRGGGGRRFDRRDDRRDFNRRDDGGRDVRRDSSRRRDNSSRPPGKRPARPVDDPEES